MSHLWAFLFEALSGTANARGTTRHHVVDFVSATSADLYSTSLVLASFLEVLLATRYK